jgi:hypothetical protein
MPNAAHVHLLFNHLPAVLPILALAVIAYARWRGADRSTWEIAIGLLALAGLAAIVANFSGESAADLIASRPGVNKGEIDEHHSAAKFTLYLAVVGGVGAVAVYRKAREDVVLPGWAWGTAAAIAVVVGGSAAYTAEIGAHVRHPELRAGAEGKSGGKGEGKSGGKGEGKSGGKGEGKSGGKAAGGNGGGGGGNGGGGREGKSGKAGGGGGGGGGEGKAGKAEE